MRNPHVVGTGVNDKLDQFMKSALHGSAATANGIDVFPSSVREQTLRPRAQFVG